MGVVAIVNRDEIQILDLLMLLLLPDVLKFLAHRRLNGLLRPPRRFHLLIVQESKKVNFRKPLYSQCLKITEKVAFNIVSEASYVYILSGQTFSINAKSGSFL